MGPSAEAVCFPHPGACRHEGGLQPSHGGDGRKNAQVRRNSPVWFFLFAHHILCTDIVVPNVFRFKIYGELPLLSLRISDDKVRGVLALLSSIPLPESRPAPQTRAAQVTPKVIKRTLPFLHVALVYCRRSITDINVPYRACKMHFKKKCFHIFLFAKNGRLQEHNTSCPTEVA